VGKHTLEKQAAMHADCFTTVSPITGRESEQLLGRKPDVITLNGFEPNFVPQGKAFNTRREAARQAFIRVAEQLTGRPVPANALLIATSGRYEYRNKGIDVFIEALHRVKQSQPTQPILAFILVPAGNPGPREDLKQRLSQKILPTSPLPDPYFTHNLAEQASDAVCNHLQALDFTNRKEAGVQIVFVPSYLNGDDGIFDLPYYDLLPGLDLTIFPSYYEPWGYTPLESIAFHVPTLTTNLSGFGQWAQMEANKRRNTIRKQEGLAVTVVERTDTNYFEVAEAIKNAILRFLAYDLQQIREIRKAAHSLSKKADWKHFISHYLEAYAISFKKQQLRKK
jgi:glycosyltransferase involved in cell wall biosynthesis